MDSWSAPTFVVMTWFCWAGGPRRVSPNEIAETFSRILGRPLRIEVVPRGTWDTLFKSQGTKNPAPRIQMLAGFNAGGIDFEGGTAGTIQGKVELETVLKDLVEHAT
jgi:NAD(P)H dehydrogenase (quinone)